LGSTQIVRLAWIGNRGDDTEVDGELISSHLNALSHVPGVGRTAAYRLVPLDPLHQRLRGNLRLITSDGSAAKPRLLVLSELQSMRHAVDAEDQIRALPLERDDHATTVVGRQVVAEISREAGVHDSEYKEFAPAIQVGLYSMDSPESERHLAWWYHHRRFAPFHSLDGGIRARWFAVVWGSTKYCVMYEFVTRDAHSEFIAKVESLAHDKSHVTGDLIPHTIHDPVLSQSVGVKVPLARPTSR
jgi:hypothetical protein